MQRVRLTTPPILRVEITLKRYGSRGPLYSAIVIDGHTVKAELETTRHPFTDAARKITEQYEYPTGTVLQMFRLGDVEPALSGRLHDAAQIRVAESDAGGIRHAKYIPLTGEEFN